MANSKSRKRRDDGLPGHLQTEILLRFMKRPELDDLVNEYRRACLRRHGTYTPTPEDVKLCKQFLAGKITKAEAAVAMDVTDTTVVNRFFAITQGMLKGEIK